MSRTAELMNLKSTPHSILDRARLGPESTYPAFMRRGKGPYLWDVDERRFVDWVLGKGPVTLGHANPDVEAVMHRRLALGFQLTMAPEDYPLLARALAAKIPACDKFLFLKNGTDAVRAAVRLARVATGREIVAYCGYHSWQDQFIPEGLAHKGVPPSTRALYLNFRYDVRKLDQILEAHRGNVSAVLVTPEPAFFDGAFLHQVEARAREAGALFIMDEIRCGYHFTLGGATEHDGLAPDLLTLSKGMGNGYPISAVGGRADIMDAANDTFMMGSYFYDALGVAAALEVLRIYEAAQVIRHMCEVGSRLMAGLNAIFAERGVPALTLGPPSIPYIVFEEAAHEAIFFRECCKRGILFFPRDTQCVSLSHTSEQVRETLDACRSAVDVLLAEHPVRRRDGERPISSRGLRRYEDYRMIENGTIDVELLHQACEARWPGLAATAGAGEGV